MLRLSIVCLVVGVLLCRVTISHAQEIESTEENTNRNVVPFRTQAQGTRDVSAPISTNDVAATPRRFVYSLNLGLRAAFDDNIFLLQDAREGDFYFTVEPQISLGFGDIVGSDQNYVRLDYAPGVIFYLDHSEANAVQHIISLHGQYHFQKLSITLSQTVELLEGSNLNSRFSTDPNPVSPVNLDTGGNVDQDIYTTNAAFSFDLSGKTFLSGALSYVMNNYEEPLIDSQTLSGNLFMNYTYSPKLVVGLGATVGYDLVGSASSGQSYEQINVRITYQATGKISINLSTGVEFRQFGNEGSNVSPVYELDASYQPFDGTTISLSGSRRTENSAVVAGQDYALTNLNLSIRQRFIQRIYVGLAIGYENTSYFSTDTGAATSREDNYYFFQPAIDVTITRYWTSGAYYLHRENDSTTFGFDDNQFGLRTSLAF
jgi:hypothetical protein